MTLAGIERLTSDLNIDHFTNCTSHNLTSNKGQV